MAAEMSQVIVEEYSALGPLDRPRLFTHTRDFGFHARTGRLVHRKLPGGPKGYTVVAVRSTGHEASFLEQDRVAVTLPLVGLAEVRTGGRAIVTRPGEVFSIGPCERRSSLFAHGPVGYYSSYTIVSPPFTTGIPGNERWLHRSRPLAARYIKRLVDFGFGLVEGGHAISVGGIAHLEALIEDVFVAAIGRLEDERDVKSTARRHEWVVRAAQTYMEARFRQPLSIADVAASVCVGVRTLQVAFENRRGTTPKRYLTDVRLHAMRRRLTRAEPGTTVTSAALDSGILHVGRGICAYRRKFGESPAETLRSAQSMPAGSGL